MARFAVLLFAALAFQAAFAGVARFDSLATDFPVGEVGLRTGSNFGVQIKTLANGLTATLESISIDNKLARQVLVEQSREFALTLERIVERLQTETGFGSEYGTAIPQQVAVNLRRIVASLQKVMSFEDVASAQTLKMQLIELIQVAAAEIEKLLWIGQDYLQQIQGRGVNTVVYGILSDFVAALEKQQIQLQNIFHTSQYGQGTQQLAIQIQAITNNMAIFLQNAPVSDEQLKQNIVLQAHKLARIISMITENIEMEVTRTSMIDVIPQLRQTVVALQKIAEFEASTSVYQLSSKFSYILQKVAVEMKKLAMLAQTGVQMEGTVDTTLRRVLMQYLVILQQVQVQLQGVNQTVQIGQTPRELALQIQVAARRLSGMLRVAVPDVKMTHNSLVWQARRFAQIIENIANRLQVETATGNGQVELVFRKVASNLNQIQMSLKQAISAVGVVSVEQLKIQLAIVVQEVAIEMQKLMWVARFDMQQGGVNTLIKGVLIDFLAGLQNLRVQIQNSLQIVLTEQDPKTLAIHIQSIASRISALLRWAQPDSQQLRQTIVIQIGEFLQTIENIVELLQKETKISEQFAIVFQKVAVDLNKISMALQRINEIESTITVNELAAKLDVVVQNVVVEMQKLAFVAQAQIQSPVVDTHKGVLNGVFNNLLATLRNMFIQLQNTHQFGESVKKPQELANQIQVITNHVATSLQNVVVGTKQVKQALAIQTLKFARRVRSIVERLENEVSFDSTMDISTLRPVIQNLKHIVLTLQQLGGSLTTTATTDLRSQLNAQLQNVDAQIQKLLLIQTALKASFGEISTVVKSVLIDYLSAVQNLQISIHRIAQYSQKVQTLPQLAIIVESVATNLLVTLQRIVPTSTLIGETIAVETRQVAQVIASIVNKLQFEGAGISGIRATPLLDQVASQLKEIQLTLQQVAETETDVHQKKVLLAVSVQRVAAVLEKLVWAVEPELHFQQFEIQGTTGITTVVREVLNEFLAVVQNAHVQILNVIQNGQVRGYSWAMGLLGVQMPFMGLQGKFLGDSTHPVAEIGFSSGLFTQSPKELMLQVQTIANKLSVVLQNQQAPQLLSVQAEKFAQVLEAIIFELQREVSGSDIMVQQVIIRLRELQQDIKKVMGYSAFAGVTQLKMKLDKDVQFTAAEIEKLISIAHQTPAISNLVAKKVVDIFVSGAQKILFQVQGKAMWDIATAQGLKGLRGLEGVRGVEGLWDVEDIEGLKAMRGLEGVKGVRGLWGPEDVKGLEGLRGFDDVQDRWGVEDFQGLKAMRGLEDVKGMRGLWGLEDIKGLKGLRGTEDVQDRWGFENVFDVRGF